MNVLIVDDSRDFCSTIADIVEAFGHNTHIINTPGEALEYLSRNNKDLGLMLLDIEFGPGETMNGLDVLEQSRINYPQLPVVMISGKGTIDTAVRATKLGAINFIEKSVVSKQKIQAVIKSAMDRLGAEGEAQEILKLLQHHGIYGNSRQMIEIGDAIIRFGRTDLNVLVSGETGTGKKLVARALHAVSRRNKYPFVTVDIPNIPRELFQSELFGHNKGAFSGATEKKKGLFHKANKGTLFLDEIGDLSLDLQANLFLPIEERVVRRVGSVESEDVDIRFVSATDRDLIEAMNQQKFREQLYHRLRECEINIPPLRERRDDIPHILDYYVQMHNRDYDESKYFSPGAIDMLTSRDWPGNIRELASVIRVALQTAQRDNIEAQDLSKSLMNSPSSNTVKQNNAVISTGRTLKEDLALTDKKKIEMTLEECKGNVSKSAAILGISRETLHNKIRKYEINVQQYRKKAKK